MTVQLSGVSSMAKDFVVSLTGVVKSDSSSAIGTAHRDGLGGWDEHRGGCRTMGFGQIHGSGELHFDARSRGQSISRSIFWRIFMNGLIFISTEVRCEDTASLPMRELIGGMPDLE